ncbi:MAG: Winged helix DNA-binding domain [Myxococcaceae bacterium]|nr:Winged helix DNA-binding domain [Myxococcaceae bacterium]
MTDRLPKSLRESPLFLTARASQALTQHCRDALAQAGFEDVGAPDLAVLGALEGLDHGENPSKLAKALRYEKSSLTPILVRLREAGLVAQVKDPKDARALRITITKKGSKRRKEAEAVIEAATEALLRDVPKKVLRHHAEFCEALLLAVERGEKA